MPINGLRVIPETSDVGSVTNQHSPEFDGETFMAEGYWRHKYFHDVDFFIVGPVYGGRTYLRVKGFWVLQHNHKEVLGHGMDRILIKRSDLKNWTQVPE